MENKFEKLLWNFRYITILAVILSILSALTLIVIGSWDIIEAVIFYNPLFDASISSNNELLFKLISAIDLFLIGIVLLIFGFGIYELFVSEIDFANAKFSESTLKIRDLDQLKNKIIKVIIIVLIVKFFEKVLKFSENFTTPMDILYFGLSILSICVGYYLINRK
ncbi:YqhA family protein [Bacteroidota bacterium]|nr:YqhA family protein [Bacteroidota bacterium]|tara:strand:+ start:284 stop:778 length:495 start_codon:yes stop_codon:yes gene_type:complete